MNADPTPTPGTFPHIEQTIRALTSEKAIGDAFEWLCRFFLRNAPQYKSELKAVWLWNEWPGRWGIDKGIDLVAEATDGKLWAIQAKGVHPDRTIPKRELDSFLSESNRAQFDFRLIIASTDDIGRNALDTIKGQAIPVGLVLRGDLLAAELRWPSQIGEQPHPLLKKEPRPHQDTAITKVVEGFRTHDRGQLIMACGTGKTVTALWIAEHLNSRRTLVLVPSLSLVSQTLTEWGRNCREPFDYLVVCSDETAAHRGEDHAVNSTGELGVPVTTDPAAISQFLARQRGGKPAVVFCTYQSSDRVAESQRSTTVPFDLVIADEAHRCAGHAESCFATILDASKIKAKKRLFMTATPRYFTEWVKSKAEDLDYELASMDDPERFGPEFYSLSFADAIDADLLTDYQVVVIGVTQAEARNWADEARLVRTEDGLHTDARTLAAQIGLAKAMREYDLRKIITFHSSVAKASRFTDALVPDSLVAVIDRLPIASQPSGSLWANHISGKTPAGKRTTLLHTFGTRGSDTRSVLSNCSCLGEGVDVPALDGIAFIDPKRSMVDIIQAVGRVMRKAPDKRLGTVVIPVFVDESDDAEYALSSSAFEPVWQVLRALRAHDTTLAAELDELRVKLGNRSPYGGKIRLPEKIKLDVPTLLLRDFEQSFYVRALERAARRPPLTIEQILAWVDAHHQRTRQWPSQQSGPVHDTPGEKWGSINGALHEGLRGLPGGSSLAQVLADHGRKRNPMNLPDLTVEQILAWADAHHQRTGQWPNKHKQSGAVHDAPGETWSGIATALNRGTRGLPGGSSLAQVLADHGRKRNPMNLPALTVEQILAWADAHHQRTRQWPSRQSGAGHNAPGETWANIDSALIQGFRGLPGGSSLAQVLADHRGVRNIQNLPALTVEQILAWADAHHQRTGQWPSQQSGPVHDAPGEKWGNINSSLAIGHRGLPGGSSLAQVLADHRGVRNIQNLPALTVEQILAWADAHHQRTGQWPSQQSGPVHDAPGEKWGNINSSLAIGHRGLPGGSSLAQVLADHRGVRNIQNL
ncbi:MAG: DEAD/DEAH box helicase family protein, partial [Nitrospirota bacterium]